MERIRMSICLTALTLICLLTACSVEDADSGAYLDDASIGNQYAVYDGEKDCGIEDTLKRADENMYEYKRMMKSEEEDDLR